MMQTEESNFWDELYSTGQTGWDLGEISPPLKHYIDQLEDKSVRILIPGCGNSYEAEYLLENGFHSVTVIDISAVACEHLRSRLGHFIDKGLSILEGDFFSFQGNFDLILEQTFFCAFPPDRRADYAQKMSELLSPEGKLVGLLFDKTFDTNPPYGGSKKEYQILFEQKFRFCILEECMNSVKPRVGAELFCILKLKATA